MARCAHQDGAPRVAWPAVAVVGLALGLLPLVGPAAQAGVNSYEATRVDVGGTSVAVAVDPATDTAYAAVQSAGSPGVAAIDGTSVTWIRTVGQ
jgi:hypothetical protein